MEDMSVCTKPALLMAVTGQGNAGTADTSGDQACLKLQHRGHWHTVKRERQQAITTMYRVRRPSTGDSVEQTNKQASK